MKRRKGFTLIELLVVILILAILAALVVPKVVGRTSDAKRAKATADIRTLDAAVEQFRLDCDRYPSTEEGLQSLRTDPGVRGWSGPYITKPIPADPWGNEYLYEFPGPGGDQTFLIISYGSDGAPGGEGDATDITNGADLEG